MGDESFETPEGLRKELEEKVAEIAKKRAILNPGKQRVVWARLTTIKRLLIRHGLTSHEEFEEMAGAMVRDIDIKVEEAVLKDLGLDQEK